MLDVDRTRILALGGLGDDVTHVGLMDRRGVRNCGGEPCAVTNLASGIPAPTLQGPCQGANASHSRGGIDADDDLVLRTLTPCHIHGMGWDMIALEDPWEHREIEGARDGSNG